MTYITSIGIDRMLTEESVTVYRSIAGALPTFVASGSFSHIYPLDGTLGIDIDYDNYRAFQMKQTYTTYSGLLLGDELHIGNDIWDVRVINNYQDPDYYQVIVEEAK